MTESIDSATDPQGQPGPSAGVKGLGASEVLRKVVHMSVGLIAFAVRFLGPLWSAVCALVALLFNLFILPRIGGRALWRDGELAAGRSVGIVLYPFSVLLLILFFGSRLEVVAATWGILAFGDGMASLVGMALGRRKLPWNEKKSWLGSSAYVVFGTAAAAVLMWWTAPEAHALHFIIATCFAASVLAAALESAPQGLDDNLGVPLLTGLFLFCLVLTEGRWAEIWGAELGERAAIGFGVNLLLAGAAYAARSVSVSGVIGGVLVGTMIWAFLDWRGFLLLLAFFVLGTACTKLGYRRKAAQGLAQEKGGRRGAGNAFANSGVAALCAMFAATTGIPELFAVAFAAAFATAASDTAASEIGQLYGRRTFLITTLRPVPRGTEGAVSLEGTLAGVAASVVVAGVGVAVGLFGVSPALWVVVAAFVGTTLESLVGATLEKRGLLDNEAVNFLNTLVGALVAAGLWVLLA
ncbi:MAG: TIGR00297 family protein [Acidobacteriota bacterium]